jgi:transposase
VAELAAQAGAPVLGGSSLKAALDCDWDDPAARQHALVVVVDAVEAVEAFPARFQLAGDAAPAGAAVALAAARQVCVQDVARGPDQTVSIRQGVARDRRISIQDAQMRHGRKTKRVRVDGYKRHVLRDLDSGLVCSVGVTPANVPEASVTDQIAADLAVQHARLAELHIDRAYLSSTLVRDRDPELAIFCKAFPVRNGPRFTKTAFGLDFDRGELTCPAGVALPFALGGKVQFPAEVCAACPLRTQCTTSTRGRSVQIHPDERLLVELRARQQTPQGRAKLRERVQVEHALAHVGHWQGRRARYLGVRKNLFDLRRVAVVHNLHVLARQPAPQPQAA